MRKGSEYAHTKRSPPGVLLTSERPHRRPEIDVKVDPVRHEHALRTPYATRNWGDVISLGASDITQKWNKNIMQNYVYTIQRHKSIECQW